MLAESFDERLERARLQPRERSQSTRGADITWREYIETAQATQQHEPRAPGTNAGQRCQSRQGGASAHPGQIRFNQFSGFNQPRQTDQRQCLLLAQAARAQRGDARIGDSPRTRKCTEPATVVLELGAESHDEPRDDGNARIQAQLLERHDAREGLEEARKARRPHASKSATSCTDRGLGVHASLQRCWINIEAEYPASGRSRFGPRSRGRVAGANREMQIGIVYSAVAFYLDEHDPTRQGQHAFVGAPLPQINGIRRPPLQHSYCRFEVKRRARREGYHQNCQGYVNAGRRTQNSLPRPMPSLAAVT
jgi:hypothetical protein